MSPDDYIDRVHASLDARTDPLDDPAVVAFLDAHPEQLDAFARLCSDVRVLATPLVRHRRPRLRWRLATAAAAAALGAALYQPTAPHTGRILTAHFEEQRPSTRRTATFTLRSVLCATATAQIETWQHLTEPR